MEVFAVTIFVSLLLGILFAVLFFAERSQRSARGIEQAALLPLDDGGGEQGAERAEAAAARCRPARPLSASAAPPSVLR